MYRIRKSPNGAISASSGGRAGGIIFIIISLLRLFGYTSSKVDFSDLSNLFDLSKLSELFTEILPALFAIPFLLIGIWWYRKEAKMNRAKKLKRNGQGFVKKVKITSIEHYETSSDDNSRGFSGYYAEAKNGDMIYCSDAYQKGRRGGTSVSILKELYRSYGFEYDENETHKQDVLREYDKRVAEREFDAENGGFFKKLAAKGSLFFTKGQREIIEKGYEPEYREVNGHRLTVGDTVDVYIDPEDEKNYWMDIDFLFDK